MEIAKSLTNSINSIKDFLHLFRDKSKSGLYINAALNSNLEFMKILENNFEWDITERGVGNSDAYQYAIEGGHLYRK